MVYLYHNFSSGKCIGRNGTMSPCVFWPFQPSHPLYDTLHEFLSLLITCVFVNLEWIFFRLGPTMHSTAHVFAFEGMCVSDLA